ncbi:single-stranded DNA-binding protein [Staphylococcus chromogenes]|nr:single-stranded DNA-binding protein [Staphylococcus chromogenes]
MANEHQFTIVGNLTADPELRYTPSGAAVATFRVASTPRTFDRQQNQWVDGQPLFLECQAWRQLAENIEATLAKGMRVIVQGNLGMQHWQDQNTGQNRSKMLLDVQAVGPDLRYAQAQVQRITQNQQPNGGWGAQQAAQQPAQQANNNGWGNHPNGQTQTPQQPNNSGWGNQQPPAGNDPWNSQPQGAGFNQDEEPPF